MHWLRQGRARWVVPLLCWLGLLVLPAPAAAGLSWSPAIGVDRHAEGIALDAVACASTSQCTAVDGQGREVTFNPGLPESAVAAVVSNYALVAVACPASTQCTAVDIDGREVTFDPQSPGTPTPVVIDTGHALYAVACPVAAQCTAVDDIGREVTFDPQSPGTPARAAIESGQGLPAIACPTTTQCTAVDDAGEEITFNPLSPRGPAVSTIDVNPAVSVACPSVTQCSAVDAVGQEVTFDPWAPAGRPERRSMAPTSWARSRVVRLHTAWRSIRPARRSRVIPGESGLGRSSGSRREVRCPGLRVCRCSSA